MKKVLMVSMACLLLFVAATGCGCSKNKNNGDNNSIANTEQDVIKDQVVEGLNFTNTALIITNGESTLTTTITNNTSSDVEIDYFRVTAKDKNGNVIDKFLAYAGDVVPAGGVRKINSSTDRDLTDATSIEYEMVDESELNA